MITIEQNAGCLIEVRWSQPVTAEDEHYLLQRVGDLQQEKIRKVVCLDARSLKLLPSRFTETLGRDLFQQYASPDLVRSAVLTAKSNAIGTLQHTRMLFEVPAAKQKGRVYELSRHRR